MNDVTKEGSAARAADRGRDAFDPIPAGKPYLGSPEVIDSLVRSFLGRVVDVRKQYLQDEIPPEDAKTKVLDLAGQYAAVVMGQSEEYGASAWNSPDQLGEFLSMMLDGVSPADSAEVFFTRMAADLLNQILIPSENEQIDDETGQFRVDVLVEESVNALQGLIVTPED